MPEIEIGFDDLDMWNKSTDRDPFKTAHVKATRYMRDGYKPVITWHDDNTISVKRGDIMDLKPREDYKKSDLVAMRLENLKTLLKRYDISNVGSKPELIERFLIDSE